MANPKKCIKKFSNDQKVFDMKLFNWYTSKHVLKLNQR